MFFLELNRIPDRKHGNKRILQETLIMSIKESIKDYVVFYAFVNTKPRIRSKLLLPFAEKIVTERATAKVMAMNIDPEIKDDDD